MVDISLDAWTVGGLDPTDYVKLYKIVDGGKEELIGALNRSHNDGAKIKGTAKGKSLILVIRGKVSASDEVYYIDNLSVIYRN